MSPGMKMHQPCRPISSCSVRLNRSGCQFSLGDRGRICRCDPPAGDRISEAQNKFGSVVGLDVLDVKREIRDRFLEEEDPDRFDLSFNDFCRERDYDACMDTIESVGMCERVGSPDRTLDDDCCDFIREYSNYEGCVKLHKDDLDFLGDSWYIFLDASRNDLWRPEREAIALIDRNGLIVDVEEY